MCFGAAPATTGSTQTTVTIGSTGVRRRRFVLRQYTAYFGSSVMFGQDGNDSFFFGGMPDFPCLLDGVTIRLFGHDGATGSRCRGPTGEPFLCRGHHQGRPGARRSVRPRARSRNRC